MPIAPLVAVPLAAGLTALLIVLLRPLLVRYALARPNARSSHSVPTPQGGGIALILAIVVVSGALIVAAGSGTATLEALVLAHAALALALLGAVDDVRPLLASLRLGFQALVVTALVLAVGGRLLPWMPLPLERSLAVIASDITN